MPTIRPYDPDRDADGLWALKHAFETDVGQTGDAGKRRAYEDKLTTAYRTDYLEWVDRCRAADPDCVQVAVDDDLVGYVFVLPESFAYIWDGAVLNEIYVHAPYRGTGVADDLFAAALTVVEDQTLPMDRLLLDVDRGNPRAQGFYDRHGFEHWGELLVRNL